MKGNIYCGHCKNRLTLATSGHKKVSKDGTVTRQTRFRYQCHYGIRHPYCCNGQSVYSVDKLDALVEEILMLQLSKLRASDGRKAVEAAHNIRIENAKALCRRIHTELTEAQAELTDYQNEILRIIRGKSAFTQAMLTPLLEQAQEKVCKLTAELEQATEQLRNRQANAEQELQEYNQLQTWADLYKSCSFDEKKMFVSRFIKRLYVYRGYRLEIEFNVSFEDFQKLTIDTVIAS